MESGQQEICDDPSSVRSGIVVLQSLALVPWLDEGAHNLVPAA